MQKAKNVILSVVCILKRTGVNNGRFIVLYVFILIITVKISINYFANDVIRMTITVK